MKHKLLILLVLVVSILNIASLEVSATTFSFNVNSGATVQKKAINLDGAGGIPIASFVNSYGKSALGGGSGNYYYQGYRLSRDYAVNSGSGGHGGSYWKLFNKWGQRIGTYDIHGRWLRP